MDGQRASAQITLTVLNPLSLLPSKRLLELNPEQRKIAVGRASKSIGKGLVAAIDNAWFDSPVMSRNHAEILLHSDNTTVQIKDVGSMHGTTLNDQELQRQEPRSLNNGDIVKFGAEVRRGPETFPACSFRVEYNILPLAIPAESNTNILNSIDLDDDVDDVTDEDERQSVHASPNNQPLQDITLSDSPPPNRSVSLEIVEEFSGPKGLTEGQALEDIMNMRKPSGNAENPLVVEDSEDEDMNEEMEVELSDDSDHDSRDSSPGIFLKPLEVDSDSESESEAEEEVSEVVIEEVRRLSDNNGIKISNVRSTAIRDNELWGDSDAIDSDSEIESDSENDVVPSMATKRSNITDLNEAEDSDDTDSVDNDSIDSVLGDIGISYQASEPESDAADDSSASPSSDDDSDMAVTTHSDEISKYEIMKKALASEEFLPKTTPAMPPWIARPIPTPEVPREPSPSDAAMVKEDNPTPATTVTSSIFEQTNINSSSSWSTPLDFVQSMGEKTGKEAFFHAREMNKAQIAAKSDPEKKSPESISAPRPGWPPGSLSARHSGFNGPTLPPFSALLDRHEQLKKSLDQSVQRVQEQVERARELAPRYQSPTTHTLASFVLKETTQLEQQGAVQSQFQQVQDHALRTHEQAMKVHDQAMRTHEQIFKAEEERKRCQDQLHRAREQTMRSEQQTTRSQNIRSDAVSNEGSLFPRVIPQEARPGAFKSRIFSLHNERQRSSPQVTYPPASVFPLYMPQNPAPTFSPAHTDRLGHCNGQNVKANETLPSFNVWVDPIDTATSSFEPAQAFETPVIPESESKKRKADDISVLTESEVNSSNEESVWSRLSTEEPIDVHSVNNVEPQPLEVAAAPVVAPIVIQEEQPEHPRPAKRFKRFAEAMGYAAIGGAAVGAGLFSVLVATAPDFL